jgi:hypothetical protein
MRQRGRIVLAKIALQPGTPEPRQKMRKYNDTEKASHALHENTVEFLRFFVADTSDALVVCHGLTLQSVTKGRQAIGAVRASRECRGGTPVEQPPQE